MDFPSRMPPTGPYRFASRRRIFLYATPGIRSKLQFGLYTTGRVSTLLLYGPHKRPMTLIEAAKMPDRLTKPSPKRPTIRSPRNLPRSHRHGVPGATDLDTSPVGVRSVRTSNKLEELLDHYLKASGLEKEPWSPLFPASIGKTGKLSRRPLVRTDAADMLKRRLKQAGFRRNPSPTQPRAPSGIR